MIDPRAWLAFAAASLVLTVVPGPAVMFVLARGVDLGRRGALLSAAGLALGNLAWAVAAGLGVASLVASSEVALTILRWAGAAYLAYLGVTRLRRPLGSGAGVESSAGGVPPAAAADRRAFRQGVVVNLLNPKIAVFVVAFLPAFLEPERGSVAAQGLVLGLTFATIGWVTDSGYAVAAGSIGRERLERFGGGWLGRVALGGTYLALAAVTLLAR